MKNSTTDDAAKVPDINNISAHQQLFRHYLNLAQPNGLFKQVSIHLYHPDQQKRPPVIINLGAENIQHSPTYAPFPIIYQRQKIGDLYITSKQPPSTIATAATQVSKKIALLLKRYQSSQLSAYYLGKKLSLTGYSERAFTLDSFIEKAASAKCPVVIKGDFGCEKLAIASAIHYNSPNRHKPFIEINCSLTTTEAFKLKLMACFKQAREGCVYFHGIDELSFSQQSLLIELLAANTQHSESKHPQINTTDIRLLLSTTQSLSKLVEHNTFSRQLYAELNFLHVSIPSLKERREDIPLILENRIKQYRLFPEQDFSKEAKAAFYHYHWPENDLELERTVARVMALANNTPIGLDELQQHSPELLASNPPTPESSSSTNKSDDLLQNLIEWLMKKEYDKLSELHPGLQKALRYLAENYCQGFTLGELAQNAFISPSHLSYLLKFTLERSFKQILAELRIEKAKQIFVDNSNSRITDVSLDVGFGDLSHFEKIFKRYTNMTPRQYKNSNKLHAES